MTTALSLRQEKVKQREGVRLKRTLRSLFGGKDFGFLWTDDSTSYTDGETIWVKYEVQTEHHRLFSPEESRILRKGHGLHERGHIEFDYLPDYAQWQVNNHSTRLEEWKDFSNPKYPIQWLQFFGNMSMDGRMENFVVLKFPTYKDYVDFTNYEWRFGIREEGIGENPIQDFQDCYSSRVLGMNDLEGWLPEAVELVNTVQEKIEELRFAPSTKECLELVSSIMKEVWPTLAEWMELNDIEMDHPPADYQSDSHEDGQQWGDSKETRDNAQTILVQVEIAKEDSAREQESSTEKNTSGSMSESEGKEPEDTDESDKEKPSKPDFSHIIRIEEKQQEKDFKEADELVSDFEEKNVEVSIEIPDKKTRLNEEVVVKAYHRQNANEYAKLRGEIKRFIKPTSKALRELLEGEKDQVRKNVRSGRFMPNKAWKAVHCSDSNVFQKHKAGTPKGKAFVSLLGDISGSTCCLLPGGIPVYQEIQKAMLLLLESCVEAGIPTTAHAFTEDDETIIYPIKPNPYRYGEEEKSYLGAIKPELGNRDTLALQWSLDQLVKRQEDIRLAIILSDGLPVFEHGEGPETIRNMVEKAEKQGIDVLCLFVGDPSPRTIQTVRDMYPGRAIFSEQNIASELQKQVKRIIRQRRK